MKDETERISTPIISSRWCITRPLYAGVQIISCHFWPVFVALAFEWFPNLLYRCSFPMQKSLPKISIVKEIHISCITSFTRMCTFRAMVSLSISLNCFCLMHCELWSARMGNTVKNGEVCEVLSMNHVNVKLQRWFEDFPNLVESIVLYII